MRFGFTVLFFCVSVAAYAFPKTPDASITPGELCSPNDPDFKEYRYNEQIPYCERSVTSWRKAKIYDVYGIPENERNQYTIDHLIPLSIGGSNSDENLWAEHLTIKYERGTLEYDLYVKMRDGVITQKEAVRIILCSKFENCLLAE
jgi:hypothetical protein